MNLLNEPNDSKFVTRKWNIVNDQSNANYDVGNEIIYNTEDLKSTLCDYNSAYILVRGSTSIVGHQATQVAFENCALFTKRITKLDGKIIDDAKDSDLVMSMYNLIEHRSPCSETRRSLWFYSKYEATNFNADIANDNNFKSFRYKAKVLENTEAEGGNGIFKKCNNCCAIKIFK